MKGKMAIEGGKIDTDVFYNETKRNFPKRKKNM
jgi:hypothetical protein